MSDFCPDGYVPSQDALIRVAEFWFPDKIARLDTVAPDPQTKAESNFEAEVRAFSQPQIPEAWRHAFEEITTETVQRLRKFLHQSTLTAYYFDDFGRHGISREFWATAPADGVIETGTYWPLGKQMRIYETRPNYRLFLLQSELDGLLSEQPPNKRPFPKSKMPALVAALRTLDDLSRRQQREALRRLPEFEQYHLTDGVLREAEKQVPSKPGRKPLRPEQ